ncbi:MAG: FlgD immunoglobulin-like domain containing protein [candidate division Zixibacteria bacterium]|nr:FlgD immunoglobulin-like domain containing protein [candidate division Zixibacteria bacterium]
MKRNVIVAVVVLLIGPALVLAADTDRFAAAKALPNADGLLVVPLEITNSEDLTAMDIPLSFTEGATLEKVEFTDRVKSFEFQAANINNEKRQVVIGLISMVSKQAPDLASGSGTIANLYFKLDPGVNEVTLTPVDLEDPNHSLMFYCNDYSSGQAEVKAIRPEFSAISVSAAEALPMAYALSQNSPNPFNPTTTIYFAAPQAGQVKVAVFNILGQNIKDLVDGYMEAGYHQVVWDGKDRSGDAVASGIYFYKISANNFSDTKKMVLLK